MLVSIVIRTYNEERYLDELLAAISSQITDQFNWEVVIVDSGSTDSTLRIAAAHDCRVTHIMKSDFTFGRSLNVGCEAADGEVLAFLSGHCVPASNCWLQELCKPLANGDVDYAYGRQVGRDTTKYSEAQHFEKWFPGVSKVPQDGFFCNNANAAITKTAWSKYKFNEELSGLEDMFLAKRLVSDGGAVGYVASAPVFHIHDEAWKQVKIRYEREAYALQKIMPEVHFSFSDFFRYFLSGVLADSASAIREKVFLKEITGIIMFRFFHYWGTFKGNHEHRLLSEKMKKQYFYPLDINMDPDT